MIGRFFVMLSLITGAGCNPSHAGNHHVALNCHEKLAEFLAKPTKQSLSRIEDRTNNQTCWLAINSAERNMDRLAKSVEQGNPWGARYLAEHLNDLDGGDLEDGLIALALFGDHYPEQLLTFAEDGTISDTQLARSVIMLPLSMSDGSVRQLKAMRARRVLIARVRQSNLEDKKHLALRAIDKALAVVVRSR